MTCIYIPYLPFSVMYSIQLTLYFKPKPNDKRNIQP